MGVFKVNCIDLSCCFGKSQFFSFVGTQMCCRGYLWRRIGIEWWLPLLLSLPWR